MKRQRAPFVEPKDIVEEVAWNTALTDPTHAVIAADNSSNPTSAVDAVIAASVLATHSSLVTLNARHFPMLADVIVPYRKR